MAVPTVTMMAPQAVATVPMAAPQAVANAIPAPSINLVIIMPVLIVLGAACVSVLVEAALPRTRRYPAQVVVSLAAVLAAGIWTLVEGSRHNYAMTFSGALAVDAGTYVMWGVLLVLGLVSLLLMADRVSEPGGAFVAEAAARVGSVRARVATRVATPMQTEVFPLALFALGGMLVFPASSDLITLFVSLEVLSLPLYLLCGLARRRRLLSQEAAVKYFLLGAFTSAILLYGIALLYGYAGSIQFGDIAAKSATAGGSDTLLLAGIGLITVGLLFKASVGPFHLWTPDVYQGAPTPVTAFMASCTKVAAFAAMLRVLTVAMGPMQWTWRPVLEVIAAASMIIGAVLGITQTDMKRVLAYSSVAHAGFIILGVLAVSEKGASGTMFYLLTYGFATIGSFAIFTVVRKGNGEASRLADWAGLAKRSPVLAAILSIFLLSFAGIPLTSGFIGKFSVFTAAMDAGMGWLVVVAMIATAVTAYFYLRIIVLMYFSPPTAGGEESGGDPYVVVPGTFTAIVIGASALVTVVLGVYPTWFLHLLTVPMPLLH